MKLKASERKLIKSIGFSSNIHLYTNKKGKSTLIWKYPSYFKSEIVNITLYCLRNFQINNRIFNYKVKTCIQYLIDLGCIPLLELYLSQLMLREVSNESLIKGLSLLIEQFGIHNKITHEICDKLSEKGIPQDYLEEFLISDKKLDTSKLLKNINELNDKWQKFWKYKTLHNCIFCKLDLISLQPITRRLDALTEMHCCKLLCCKFCYLNYLDSQEQCPACNSFSEYNKYTNEASIDIDCDNLHYTMLRNFHRKSQNIEFNTSPGLYILKEKYVQPGSEEYGKELIVNRKKIIENYRFNKLKEGMF